jgi:SPFH domain / Band 7 family
LIERTRWLNLQVDTADVPAQDLITKDNVTVRVEAAVFFRVVDPVKAVVQIRDYQHGVLRIAQTTLRAMLGQHDLDDLLAKMKRAMACDRARSSPTRRRPPIYQLCSSSEQGVALLREGPLRRYSGR